MFDLKSKRIICPSMQGKHERLAFDRSILIKLTTFFSWTKIQEELVMLSSIFDKLDITAESLFYVVLRFSIQNERKVTAIYMHP